ncbi:MAG: OmpA family protein [Syntrophales bacterium]|nr:OmpA family protein [Syntrophales bacterium]
MMLRNFSGKLSLLMVSLLLVSCASQKSLTPFNTAVASPELISGQPVGKVDNLTTDKPIAVSLSQPVEAEKEVTPAKETGSATDEAPVSKAEPVPEKVSIALNVQFDTGKANIKPTYLNDIKRLADFMNKYPSTSALIEGHTDNVGNKMVNVKLAQRRADNIKAYLTEKYGIESSRIKVKGYDYQRPIASNKTAEGRQKNRRGETRIETNAIKNRLYSFIEDSDLPKGGFSIVNQETIDEKIKSFREKQGVASYSSQMVDGATLELYVMWGGIFSHCAIRIETDPKSFYQVELQTLPDLKKAGLNNFHKIGAAINLLGMTEDQFDVVEFTDKNERKKLDKLEPNYAAIPICIGKKAAKETTQWYRDCLSRYAGGYNPENALRNGNQTRVFDYNPVIHNCCNFVEEALEACGLAHCFDLGKSTGLNHETGPLEE